MNVTEYLEKKFGPHPGNPQRLEGFLRSDMYKMFAELGFTQGCEVGIEKGKNAQTMYEIIPNLHLYGVDSFKEHPQASYVQEARKRNWDENYLADVKRQCLRRMKDKNFTLIEEFSEDATSKIPDNSLDFVYIDADHSYDMMMLDVIKWGRKLKKGGVLSGHDYYRDSKTSQRRSKVVQALNDYTNVHGIKFYITDENHAEAMGDIYPSWFWVKLDDIWPNVIKKDGP